MNVGYEGKMATYSSEQRHQQYLNHREKNLAYVKEWRKRNPEKAKLQAERHKPYQHQHYLDNIDVYKERAHKHYLRKRVIYAEQGRKKKRQVLTAYSGGHLKCARCGVADIDILCIDHVNGGGNQHRKSLGLSAGTHFYKWLEDSNFPDGFQVLCYNCNMKKRIVEDYNGEIN